MPTRNVVITDQQEGLIGSLIDSGRYQNASEVLRAGLRLLELREREGAARLAALRAAVDLGIADLDTGRLDALSAPADVDAYLADIVAGQMPGIQPGA